MSNPRTSDFVTCLPSSGTVRVEYTASHGEIDIESVTNLDGGEVTPTDAEYQQILELAASCAQMDWEDGLADEMERRAEQRRDDARDGSRP